MKTSYTVCKLWWSDLTQTWTGVTSKLSLLKVKTIIWVFEYEQIFEYLKETSFILATHKIIVYEIVYCIISFKNILQKYFF